MANDNIAVMAQEPITERDGERPLSAKLFLTVYLPTVAGAFGALLFLLTKSLEHTEKLDSMAKATAKLETSVEQLLKQTTDVATSVGYIKGAIDARAAKPDPPVGRGPESQ